MATHQKNKEANLLLGWLEKPYYLNESLNFKLFVAIGMGLLTTIFLIVFKPLDLEQLTENIIQYSLVCGLIVSIVLFFYFFLIRSVFTTFFNKKTWNIGKHLFVIISLIFLCATFIWVFNQFISSDKLVKAVNYKNVIELTFKIGIVPLVFFLLFDERYGKYEKELTLKEKKRERKKTAPLQTPNVTLISSNRKNSLSFNINNLIFISSESNYGSFFLIEKGKLKEHVLRTTLNKIEKDLSAYKQILRCHKSYIINTKQINNFYRNSNGYYYFNINFSEKEIPISRKFKKEDIIKLIS